MRPGPGPWAGAGRREGSRAPPRNVATCRACRPMCWDTATAEKKLCPLSSEVRGAVPRSRPARAVAYTVRVFTELRVLQGAAGAAAKP